MLRLMIWWLSIGILSIMSVAHADIELKRDIKQLSKTFEDPTKKSFLNIKKYSHRHWRGTQFLSMYTDKDIFPWDEDEKVSRKDHEITIAFVELSRKLHAMEATYATYTQQIREFHMKIWLENEPQKMITLLCDYIEQGLKNDSTLYPEYETIKNKVKAYLGNGTFFRNVHFQQLPNNSAEIEKELLSYYNSVQIKQILFDGWLLIFNAMKFSDVRYYPDESEQIIMAKSIMEAAKQPGTERNVLENLYEEVTKEMAQNMTISVDTSDALFPEKITAHLKEMEKRINANDSLKKFIDPIKRKFLLRMIDEI